MSLGHEHRMGSESGVGERPIAEQVLERAKNLDGGEMVEMLDEVGQTLAEQLKQATNEVNQLAHEFDLVFSRRLAAFTKRSPEDQKRMIEDLLGKVKGKTEELYLVPGFAETGSADQLAMLKLQMERELREMKKKELQESWREELDKVSNIGELMEWLGRNQLSRPGQGNMDMKRMREEVERAAVMAQAKDGRWREVLGKGVESNTVRVKAEQLMA